MAERVNVDLEGSRDFIEALAEGGSLSAFGGQLIREALLERLTQMSIGEIVDLVDPMKLSEETGIEFDRLSDIAVGQFPSNTEIVKLARVWKRVGLTSKVLSDMRERDFPNSHDSHPHHHNHPEVCHD